MSQSSFKWTYTLTLAWQFGSQEATVAVLVQMDVHSYLILRKKKLNTYGRSPRSNYTLTFTLLLLVLMTYGSRSPRSNGRTLLQKQLSKKQITPNVAVLVQMDGHSYIT